MNSKPETKPDGPAPEDPIDHEAIALETEFGENSRWVWLATFFGPWLVGASILGSFYLGQGVLGLKNLAVAVAATFFMFGRFVILFGGEPIGFWHFEFQMSAESLFIMLTTMDFLVAFFVAFHMDFLFKIPLMGPKLEEMVSDGRFILKHQPWIRNVAFVGLVLFVIFPSSTTGSIGGSIFGRLLGMKRSRVITAILIGSVLGNGLMLVLAQQIKQYIREDNLWLKLGGVLAMIAILFLVERYFRKLKKKYLAAEQEEKERAEKGQQEEAQTENVSGAASSDEADDEDEKDKMKSADSPDGHVESK